MDVRSKKKDSHLLEFQNISNQIVDILNSARCSYYSIPRIQALSSFTNLSSDLLGNTLLTTTLDCLFVPKLELSLFIQHV